MNTALAIVCVIVVFAVGWWRGFMRGADVSGRFLRKVFDQRKLDRQTGRVWLRVNEDQSRECAEAWDWAE